MGEESIPVSFVSELRDALHHLYNPDWLRQSTLGGLLGVDAARDPLALQNTLLKAIDALKPRPGTPPQAPSTRAYRALYHRYAEQFSQAEVARALGLSPRQLLRQERAALQALAGYLWVRYDLGKRVERERGLQPVGDALSRQQELAWLRESQASEPVAIGELIESVLQTADPLLRSLRTRVELCLPAELSQPVTQRGPLRQALLNLLLAAARSAPGGHVGVEVAAEGSPAVPAHGSWIPDHCPGQVHITLQAGGRSGAYAQQAAAAGSEAMAMARELVALAGGSLEILPARVAVPFAARLVLPAARQATVLFIDDNADALLLYQRSLTGTRYLYVGTRDPQQGLALAAELQPRAIVLDVMLPGVDGWELLGRLRANPATRDMPVLVCTILSEDQLALALGAAAFLRKPVGREALLAALDAQLKLP